MKGEVIRLYERRGYRSLVEEELFLLWLGGNKSLLFWLYTPAASGASWELHAKAFSTTHLKWFCPGNEGCIALMRGFMAMPVAQTHAPNGISLTSSFEHWLRKVFRMSKRGREKGWGGRAVVECLRRTFVSPCVASYLFVHDVYYSIAHRGHSGIKDQLYAWEYQILNFERGGCHTFDSSIFIFLFLME